MGYLRRRSRRFSALMVLAALLFTHSALAVAACIDHVQTGHATVAEHEHDGHDSHSHHHHGPAHGHSLLCQIGCGDQVQSRHYVNTLELPAPVAQKVQFVALNTPARDAPSMRVERPKPFVSAAPPPLPLTILLSRFRN